MASKRSNKDKSMAAHLKKRGVRRDTGKCCICGKTLALGALTNHYALHS